MNREQQNIKDVLEYLNYLGTAGKQLSFIKKVGKEIEEINKTKLEEMKNDRLG